MTDEIRDPVILSEAARQFGVDRRWLRNQVKKGVISSVKVGHHVLVERGDVAEIAPARLTLEKALADRRARREERKAAEDSSKKSGRKGKAK